MYYPFCSSSLLLKKKRYFFKKDKFLHATLNHQIFDKKDDVIYEFYNQSISQKKIDNMLSQTWRPWNNCMKIFSN